jgi:hypothetical protein
VRTTLRSWFVLSPDLSLDMYRGSTDVRARKAPLARYRIVSSESAVSWVRGSGASKPQVFTVTTQTAGGKPATLTLGAASHVEARQWVSLVVHSIAAAVSAPAAAPVAPPDVSVGVGVGVGVTVAGGEGAAPAGVGGDAGGPTRSGSAASGRASRDGVASRALNDAASAARQASNTPPLPLPSASASASGSASASLPASGSAALSAPPPLDIPPQYGGRASAASHTRPASTGGSAAQPSPISVTRDSATRDVVREGDGDEQDHEEVVFDSDEELAHLHGGGDGDGDEQHGDRSSSRMSHGSSRPASRLSSHHASVREPVRDPSSAVASASKRSRSPRSRLLGPSPMAQDLYVCRCCRMSLLCAVPAVLVCMGRVRV